MMVNEQTLQNTSTFFWTRYRGRS